MAARSSASCRVNPADVYSVQILFIYLLILTNLCSSNPDFSFGLCKFSTFSVVSSCPARVVVVVVVAHMNGRDKSSH